MSNKFGLGALGLGSLGNMLESVELVKKAWSGLNLPSSLAPTMDLEELDKRIADLKTVEQWLNVNLSMLRGTIQGMEIQRGTIAAVKAFGQAVSPGSEGLAAMAQAAAQAAARKAAPAAPAREAPAAHASADASAPESAASGSLANELSKAAVAAVNPAAWWNLLQSQFNQVAQAAMTGAGLGEAGQAAKRASAGARQAGGAGKTPRATRKSGTAGASKAPTKRPRRTRTPPESD